VPNPLHLTLETRLPDLDETPSLHRMTVQGALFTDMDIHLMYITRSFTLCIFYTLLALLSYTHQDNLYMAHDFQSSAVGSPRRALM
jgi:hypothetical protein